MQQQQRQQATGKAVLVAALAALVAAECAAAVITVQIGGATRLTSVSRQRDRYNCYWDCDLVGCQIARDDDECAYDCEKICRVRYDYSAVGRSGSPLAGANSDLKPKSDAVEAAPAIANASASAELPNELIGAGTSVRLHLPRSAGARNFAIWERCSADTQTGKLTEKPFNL